MVANASASLLSNLQSASARVSTHDHSSSDDASSAFDSHLDAARQQHATTSARQTTSPDAKAASADDASKTAKAASDQSGQHAVADSSTTKSKTASDKSTDKAGDKASADKTDDAADDSADDGATEAAASVAGTLLALLGQITPATAAVSAAGGAAKILSASMLKSTGGKALTDAMTKGTDTGVDSGALATDATALSGTDAAATAGTGQGLTDFSAALAAALPGGEGHKDSDSADLKDLSSLAAALPQTQAPVAATPVQSLQIASPVGSQAFTEELGQQVAWLGGQDIKEAKIRLHPENMGQLDVKVSVQDNNKVDVTFAVQHPQVVHAVQQTLSQLDSMLAQHGMSLGNADVSQQQQGRSGSGSSSSSGGVVDAIEETASAVASPVVSALGLLDTFA